MSSKGRNPKARTIYQGAARTGVLVVFFALSAVAQKTGEGTADLVFDTFQHWLRVLGDGAEKVLPSPASPLGYRVDPLSGKTAKTRELDESYPVPAGCAISVLNRFGEVRFSTWENPVVRVQAQITAGAESSSLADEVVKAINVDIAQTGGQFRVRTIEPSTKDMGDVVIFVNCVLTVPKDAAVFCQNYFGDTYVTGVGGELAIDSRFGAVDLRDIRGPVRARCQGGGEYVLRASGLRQGGTFQMSRTLAEFTGISGALKINNFMAPTIVRDLEAGADVQIMNDYGPVHLYVREEGAPEVSASVLFGSVKSEVPLAEQTTRNDCVTDAHYAPAAADRSVSVSVSFDDLFFHRSGSVEPIPASVTGSAEEVTATWEDVRKVTEGQTVIIHNPLGSVRVEGVDSDRLRIKATKRMRLAPGADAAAVRDMLQLSIREEDNRVVAEARTGGSLDQAGCLYYRVDIEIQSPRTSPVRSFAASGETVVSGLGGPVVVEQQEGKVKVEHVKGRIDVTVHNGGSEVVECAGPLTVTASGGAVSTNEIRDRQEITCVNGPVVVEEPRGPLQIKSRGGDVRIITLHGVDGDSSAFVEGGDLRLLIPSGADVTLNVTATNGIVYSSRIPLDFGSIRGEVRKYQGKLNDGRYTIDLETKDGNVIID